MKKKILALFLALCMVLSMMPVSVLAASAKEPSSSKMPPSTAGELEPIEILPNDETYAVTLSSSGRGEAALLVDSPAKVGSEVYFRANPDDGYLAEIYYEGLSMDDIVYLGTDIFGFIMPSNQVELQVKFVAVSGSKHSIEVFGTNFAGEYTLTRESAWAYESVLLAVKPHDNSSFDPEDCISVSGAPAYYLFEEEGIHCYEIIMGNQDVKIYLYNEHSVTVTAGPGGKAYVDAAQAKEGSTVTLTCVPDPNYRVCGITGVDGLTDNGNGTYSFTMPANDVSINVTFRTIYNPISITVDTGIGGTASANMTEAKAGDIVTVTCTPDDGYRVAQITGANGLTDNGDGTYCFTMPDVAVDLKILFLRENNPFLDVNETQFYYDPVLWAVENGITNGMDAEHFGPFGVCNRAQVVTFLWRAAGCPTPEGSQIPFVDVPAGSFYTDAVLWAVEKGITNGLTETTFGPNAVCNRAQVVTFLWRAHGTPAPTLSDNPFADIPTGSFYTEAVLWALENNVTSGASATTFNPGGDCLRAQVVTFLYRADQIPET